jgi:glycosyltransferase involved in cell wall biosynthesis
VSDGPLVTILIPTYSRADLLLEAIRSGLAQTHRNVELIVLDDASPDDGRTTAAVAPFLADPRVRYVRHERNLGIAGNWRAGIAAAAGAFFCLLHDDDTFEPTFVAELLAAMADDAVIAFCDQWVTDAAGVRLPEVTEQTTIKWGRDRLPAGPLADFARTALVDTSIPIGAALFRRADLPPTVIDDAARGSIDMWLLYQCIATGKRAVYVPRRLMNYRSHAGGMSAGQPLYMLEGHLWRYDQMLADPRLGSVQRDLQRRRQQGRVDYAWKLLAAGRRGEARAALAGAGGWRAGRKASVTLALSWLGPAGTAAVRLVRRARGAQP